MYEALRSMKMPNAAGDIVSLRPGDIVEGFERLPYAYQQAALEMHQVRVRPADAELAKHMLEPTGDEVREAKAEALAGAVAEEARPLLTCQSCSFETRSTAGFKMHVDRKHPSI